MADQPNNAAGAPEPANRQIQSAHDRYFQDLGSAWNACMRKFQHAQTDLERSMERAWLAQDPNAMQSAWADYQRAYQTACMEANPSGGYGEAYRKYKAAVKKAISEMSPED